jgi:hypothetical protein
LYTFFLLESPPHSGGNHRAVPHDFFNISMTYRADSDIFYPYDNFDEIEGKEEDQMEGEMWTEEEVNTNDNLGILILTNSGGKESFRQIQIGPAICVKLPNGFPEGKAD